MNPKRISAEELRHFTVYEPDTGVFRWRVTRTKARAGNQCGHLDKRNGYVTIYVNGRLFQAHTLAWLYMTGVWPEWQVDHKNRVRDDNRWENLRLASDCEQAWNQTKKRKGTSQYKGVRWSKGKWNAQIRVNGKAIHIGCFESEELAAWFYDEYARMYFGEFAATNFPAEAEIPT